MMGCARQLACAWRDVLVVGLALAGLLLPICLHSAAAQPASRAYIVAKYPVDATADDAVAAKTRAIAEGKKAAFHSLLRRLVPVMSLKHIRKIEPTKIDVLVESYSVRSERNSQTQYIASLDFSFQPEAVRQLLKEEGIPYVDEQAPSTVLILAYRAPKRDGAPEGLSLASGTTIWLEAWKGIDLDHALAPLSLQPTKPQITAEVVAGVMAGNPASLRTLASEYQSERVVMAIAEADPEARKLHVTLAGRDAAGPLHLKRSYRLDDGDLAYTSELAGIISLSILDGRWKMIRAPASTYAPPGRETYREPMGREPGGRDPFPPRPGGGPFPPPGPGSFGAPGRPIQVSVEFSGMGEWQHISRQLASTPGVDNLEVDGLSSRGARISLSYAGPVEQLAQQLASDGLMLARSGPGWVLRAR